MPKKAKENEKEVEVDLVNREKKETKVMRWFRENTVNNASELRIVCDLTSRSAEEQFSMYIKSGHNEVYGVIFYATMMSIMEFIKDKEKTYNNFTMEIAKSVNIGYINNTDDTNEKTGNFEVIMEYIGINRQIVDNGDDNVDKTNQNFIRWKELNIKKNIEYCKDIQTRSYERLKNEFAVSLRTSEAVIPLFCIFLDNLTGVLKNKYKEAIGTDISQVSINVFGLFDAYYSFDEEANEEIIEFKPTIKLKLFAKDDNLATRNN